MLLQSEGRGVGRGQSGVWDTAAGNRHVPQQLVSSPIVLCGSAPMRRLRVADRVGAAAG